ncbi:MAG: isoleucine--tRNA ligase, partial [Candidatus Omnitrophica bacterium]|nr:isoleucine--tRNA ligase [Candidatus Omnitrophota bacterium]
MKDYKDTLNLPQTGFPMRANLPAREPLFFQKWQERDLYKKLVLKNKDRESFVLHDGPPYANGDIHLGHALNKTLKDIVVRFKIMSGYSVRFTPGWDCHGLPVEHQLIKQMGLKKSEIEPVKFRKKARDYALKYVDIQKNQFQRLGCIGDWQKPYLTLDFNYEAWILRSLADLIAKGYIYKDVKPVNWCIECETALAEAEVEYEDKSSDSIYVKFKLSGSSSLRTELKLPQESFFVIWTTTPWTLISNVAVAVHPEEYYVFLKSSSGEVFIVAQKLANIFKEKAPLEKIDVIAKLKGCDLERQVLEHPFLKRGSEVVTADFVSMEEGSGCVHIAPGHGMEDYLLGRERNLPFIMPLNDKGVFENSDIFSGLSVWDANEKVKEVLKNKNALLKEEKLVHSYPHCWRCKSPIVFRATLQLFMSVDKMNLRQSLIDAADKSAWIPQAGLQRIKGMLQTRPDWCLSRQRCWGVAIPSLKCSSCKKSILDKDFVVNVADQVAKHGADIWFQEDYKKFLPDNFKCCYCGTAEFEKEYDIIDVWFESGVSHQAVLNKDYGLSYPADLYLEGSDQHRGWFQTSLITGIAIKGSPPYKAVLTHGFVVDAEGRKMSKSLGNVISPLKVIDKYGADVLRLWAISRDFTQDLRISDEILSQVVEAYRKIRNTFRFLLSNIYDFNPAVDSIKYCEMDVIDRWIYNELAVLSKQVKVMYEEYQFNQIFKKVYVFMNETLSSVYLAILKDRMYTFHSNDKKRRSAQSALYALASNLAKLTAPIMPFTAEDIWENLVSKNKTDSVFESIHEADLEDIEIESDGDGILKDFGFLQDLRSLVMKAIEDERSKGSLGSSLEADVC